MENHSIFVGVDVSKSKLDFTVLFQEDLSLQSFHFISNNDKKGIKAATKQIKSKFKSLEKVLFCFENTGVYSMPLSLNLSALGLDYWVVSPIEINKSKGLTRGKSDKTDSKDIALYAKTHIHKLKLSSLPESDILRIKVLLAERNKLMKSLKALDTSKEYENNFPKAMIKEALRINRKIVKQLQKAIKEIEQKIKEVVVQNEEIKTQAELIQSVPGVGKQTAYQLICTTNGFRNFNNWRQLACYAGVAPFEYSSGSRIRGKTKVNHHADKQLKSLLNMCALSSKKYDPQIKTYFDRKVAEGKNKMLVLNNIRCKLLSRIFAVINRQTPYINTHKFAA
ncbi:IS110 family transposase [Marivirga tractuosa]|uniref:IS110 family transposase n=1 Tax=Marivirga tractuosa TaxID=1006 RepID=UPI0035D0E6A1